MTYRVAPGLYAVGVPDGDSPVFVTANYKLSFDALRGALGDMRAWLLVLDTKGVNVWCAAGKGTFGTDEVVARVGSVNLGAVVRHRTLIVPQLGAPGVASHIVKQKTGFSVVFGPVRANDIPPFMESGLMADRAMRTVTFTLRERLAVAPIELVHAWKLLLAAILFVLVRGFGDRSLTLSSVTVGFLPYVGAVMLGAFGVPALLPWIPGRALSFKGWFLCLVAVAVYWVAARPGADATLVYALVLPPMAGYLALQFTGATPYTSLSGVRKELRRSLPLFVVSAGLGVVIGIILSLRRLWPGS
jgi:branched-subunit amino acid transport protein